MAMNIFSSPVGGTPKTVKGGKARKTSAPRTYPKGSPAFMDPGTFVTFLIGPRGTKFVVHKEFACYYSPVLKAAFNSSFIEGQTQTYVLEDTTEDTFRFFTQWLYSQDINLLVHGKDDKSKCGRKDSKASEDSKKHAELCEAQDVSLVELWILAEKFLVEPLQDLVVDILESMRRRRKASVSPACLRLAYDKTMVDSPLRHLFIHQYSWSMDKKSFRELSPQIPQQMLADMVNEYSRRIPPQTAKLQEDLRDMEDYHVIKARNTKSAASA